MIERSIAEMCVEEVSHEVYAEEIELMELENESWRSKSNLTKSG